MRQWHWLLILLLSFSLQGCGWLFEDDDDDAPERITASSADLVSYAVTGTSPTLLPNRPKPINPAENEGAFTISWAIEADGIVDVELSVQDADNETSTLCADGPYEFHDLPCGGDYSCQLEMTLDCRFDNNNLLQCSNGKGTNLSQFLDTVPKEAHLQIKVRDLNGTVCDYQAVTFE